MNKTKLAVLFSGGLDCTVLARMAHDLIPLGEHIDLLNVAFENPRVVQAAKSGLDAKGVPLHSGKIEKGLDTTDIVPELIQANENYKIKLDNPNSVYELCPDRITGRRALEELRRVCPGRMWRFVEVS